MKNTTRFSIALTLFSVLFIISFFRLDPDFGWHLRSGNYILANSIPRYDIFTYTAKNFVWINHEWLNDVIVSEIYNFAGNVALALFFGLLWSSVIVFASRKKDWFLSLLATLAMFPYVGTRPVVWSLLFFVLLERMLEGKHKYRLFFLPILFLIWANLHGGFVLGLVVLGIYTLFSKTKISPFIFFTSFVATLVNPYGLNLYAEIGRTLFDIRLHFRIQEWAPFFISASGIFYIALFCALFLFIHKENDRVRRLVSLPGALFILSFASTRYFPFFIVSSLRYLERWFTTFIQLIHQPLTGTRLFIRRLLKVLAVAIILYGFIHILYTLPQDPEAIYPKSAVAYLKRHPCRGNIFNSYDYGGYLIWKLPEKPVYIDGRMPSWKNMQTNYFARYERVFKDQTFRKREFTTYNIMCAILHSEQKNNWVANVFHWNIYDEARLVQILEKEGWERVIEQGDSVLLIKNN